MQRHIVFFGLICHVGSDRDMKRHAALVADDHHDAFVIPKTGRWQPISGAVRVRIGGTAVQAEANSKDGAFQLQVPHLDDVTDGNIEPLVLVGTSPLARAYFHYPGGFLHTHSLHDDNAEFDFPQTFETPMARTTVLTFDDGGQGVAIDFGGREPLDLGDEPCVLIANMAQSGHAHGHFKKHLRLTSGKKIANLKKKPKNGAPSHPNVCGWITDMIEEWAAAAAHDHAGKDEKAGKEQDVRRVDTHALSTKRFTANIAALDIECSQSQWP